MCKLNKSFWTYARTVHYVWEEAKKEKKHIKNNSRNYKTILPFTHFYILIHFFFLLVGLFLSYHFFSHFSYSAHIQHCIIFSFSLIYSSTLMTEYAHNSEYANWQYHALNTDYVFIFKVIVNIVRAYVNEIRETIYWIYCQLKEQKRFLTASNDNNISILLIELAR